MYRGYQSALGSGLPTTPAKRSTAIRSSQLQTDLTMAVGRMDVLSAVQSSLGIGLGPYFVRRQRLAIEPWNTVVRAGKHHWVENETTRTYDRGT